MVTTGDQFPPNSSKKVLMVFYLPPLLSFELLFLIVIRISSLNSNAQISPKMPGIEEENGL